MTKRKYGIDLLRILSMLFIVILHILQQGGTLRNVEAGTANYHCGWILNIITMCAVNCYGLISGYVNVDNKIKYHKLGAMWLQVAFYAFFITLIYYFVMPDKFEYFHWTNTLFPVCTKQYWYFTEYFALFLIMPYLNVLINNLNKQQLKSFGLIIFAVFSIAQTVWQDNIFVTNNGYSFLWLALLYILGAIIKKTDFANLLKCRWWALIFMGAVALAYIFKLSAEKTNAPVKENLLINYISVTMVIQAVSLLAIGIRLNIKNKAAVNVIKFFAPLSFSVYLIHTNPWIYRNLLKDCTVNLASYSNLRMLLSVIGIAVAIFLACTLIDYLRLQLFKALKITPMFAKAEQNITNHLQKKRNKK